MIRVKTSRLSALTVPSVLAGLTETLSQIHDPEIIGALLDLDVRPATYSFDELYGLKIDLIGRPMPETITAVRIDDQSNRLEVAALNPSDAEVLAWVAEATVSRRLPASSAVVVHGIEAVRLEQLTDEHPTGTLSGGARIQRRLSPTVAANCTLGFNADKSSAFGGPNYGFVTNAHCSSTAGSVDGTEQFQAALGDRRIGTEETDPPFLHSSSYAAQGPGGNECPVGGYCRYSDAAFYEYDVSFGSGGPGASIYRTTGANNGSLEIAESTNLDGQTIPYSYFLVNDQGPYYIMTGQTINKVGQVTGWTQGTVDENCEQVTFDGPLNQHLICQAVVDLRGGDPSKASAGRGDSGSAAFTLNSDGETVRIRGLLWAGRSQIGNTETFRKALLSHYGDIEYELGQMDVSGTVPGSPGYGDPGDPDCPDGQIEC